MLQDINKRLQKYTTLVWSSTIATYNQMQQRIAKLQNQKNTMVETMNGLKGYCNLEKLQPDMAKVRVISR
jgi:kinesin family member C1